MASSPLRFLTNVLGASNAQSRAHPDPSRDVWELSVWDPLPICLRLFCLFSPGHILVYWMFLPTSPIDPRPSITIFMTMVIGGLISTQLLLLQTNFSQQTKDLAVISKEVMHEYDTKYVHPRTQPMYRDVGTQYAERATHTTTHEHHYNRVEVYTPTVMINRGFRPNPNPNYASHTDPDRTQQQLSTPTQLSSAQKFKAPTTSSDFSSPLRPSTAIRQPSFRPSSGISDGGSLGVYSHAHSPLRKSVSTNFDRGSYSNDYARERSPEKRSSTSGVKVNPFAAEQKWGHLKSKRRESGRI